MPGWLSPRPSWRASSSSASPTASACSIVVSVGAGLTGASLVVAGLLDRLWISYIVYGLGVGLGAACAYVPTLALVGGEAPHHRTRHCRGRNGLRHAGRAARLRCPHRRVRLARRLHHPGRGLRGAPRRLCGDGGSVASGRHKSAPSDTPDSAFGARSFCSTSPGCSRRRRCSCLSCSCRRSRWNRALGRWRPRRCSRCLAARAFSAASASAP